MLFYLFLELILVFIAIIAYYSRLFFVYVFFIAIIFFVVVFRFETGTDWLYYNEHFLRLLDIFYLGGDYPIFDPAQPVEPGFILFASPFIYVFSSIQAAYWAISIYVLSGYASFAKFIPASNRAFFWIIVINFAIFSIFFSVLRQSMALATILFGISAIRGNHRYIGILLFFVSPFFHLSSIIYLSVLFLGRLKMSVPVILMTSAFIGMTFRIFIQYPNLISFIPTVSRISAYGERAYPLFTVENFFIAIFCISILLYMIYFIRSQLDRFEVILARSSIACATIMLTIIENQTLRNRLLYLLVPLSAYLVTKHSDTGSAAKRFLVFFLIPVSIFYYGAYLNRGGSIAFIPYNNSILSFFSGDWGDGAVRQKEVLERWKDQPWQ